MKKETKEKHKKVMNYCHFDRPQNGRMVKDIRQQNSWYVSCKNLILHALLDNELRLNLLLDPSFSTTNNCNSFTCFRFQHMSLPPLCISEVVFAKIMQKNEHGNKKVQYSHRVIGIKNIGFGSREILLDVK